VVAPVCVPVVVVATSRRCNGAVAMVRSGSGSPWCVRSIVGLETEEAAGDTQTGEGGRVRKSGMGFRANEIAKPFARLVAGTLFLGSLACHYGLVRKKTVLLRLRGEREHSHCVLDNSEGIKAVRGLSSCDPDQQPDKHTTFLVPTEWDKAAGPMDPCQKMESRPSRS
jgi:hypothetical protein